jgi:hypothetical protein
LDARNPSNVLYRTPNQIGVGPVTNGPSEGGQQKGDKGTCFFNGVETSSSNFPSREENVMPESGSTETIVRDMLHKWWKDLTYREWHAFVVGFVPWFLFFLTGNSLLLGAAIGVVLVCLGYQRVPNRALRAIVREPWYCLAGGALGWLAGATVLAWARLLSVLGGVVG